ncbi:glutathione S-transferase A [Hydra vulgaris]|uniref:glutathione S-transferase A n=1 Tax=Hydra vulgaris TaxID=6087 RepID=UPI0006416775|nr:glutathione S-transferase A [Hydra vulgaris]
MADQDIFLFWGSGSVPCWRPMIVLEEKGLSGYGQKLISFSDQEHKGEEIMKLNPRGQVPTFRHGSIILNESKGICHYLENQFKNHGTKLIPDEPGKQAMVLQRMYEADNIFENGLVSIMYYYMRTKPENIDEVYMNEKKKELAVELEYWERYLSGEYLAGSEFTMADVFFAPLLCVLVRSGLSLEFRPHLKVYYEKIILRPSIQASWPPHYKTTPNTTIFVGV